MSGEHVNLLEIRAAEPMGKPSRVDVQRVGDRITSAVVRGVKILGTKSPNPTRGKPTRYSDAALASAVPLYEGMRVFVDHPSRENPKAERSYRDRLGRLVNVSGKPGDGLHGDFVVNPKHPSAEQFLWDAEHDPGAVGFSHNADGVGSVVGHEFVVESIKCARSVDVVTDPATTHSLFESRLEGSMSDPKPETKPEAKPADAPAAPKPEVKPAHASDAFTALESRFSALETSVKAKDAKIDKLEVALAARDRKDRVEVLLRESKLPAFAVTDKFRTDCLDAKDDAAVQSLIEDRRTVARGSFHQEPGNPPKGDPGKAIETADEALEFIRKGGR